MATILQRIEREHPGLLDALEDLSASDLQSLLLEVARRRAAAVAPPALLRRHGESRFTRPGADGRLLSELDRLAWELLPAGTEVVELSPVAPLGSCSALSPVDQNRTLSTTRLLEVLSDSTNALALEAALRRRAMVRQGRSAEWVRLASSHRLLRTQLFDATKGFRAHFRLVALVSAGRNAQGTRFEVEALREHAAFHLRLLTTLRRQGWAVSSLELAVAALDPHLTEHLESRVLAPLAAEFPEVHCHLEPAEAQGGRGAYYSTACMRVGVEGGGHSVGILADGGSVDWGQQLLSSRRERVVTSAVGTELLASLFPLLAR